MDGNSSTSLIHDPSTNVPDYAAEESARLDREFAGLIDEVMEARAGAIKMCKPVVTADDAADFTAAITRGLDLDKRIEAIREGEKTPHLRRGTAVDNKFNGLHDLLFKRKKDEPNAAYDDLRAELHAYNVRRQQEEQRKRDEEARKQREAEDRARREREEAARLQREAEQKASRARSEASRKAADEAAAIAREETRRREADEAQQRAVRQEAEDAARAKPADMMRERHAGGLNTMRMVWKVTVEDSMALDMAALWPFIDDKAKTKAAEGWAKTTNHKKTMPGLRIEQVHDTVIRR